MRKLDIKNTTSKFIENWVDEQVNDFTRYLFQSILHWNVTYLIADAYYNKYDISYEDICDKISSRVGSRTSIQNIIKQGVGKEFFNKTEKKSDKRKKLLTFSESGRKAFENYIHADASCYEYLN